MQFHPLSLIITAHTLIIAACRVHVMLSTSLWLLPLLLLLGQVWRPWEPPTLITWPPMLHAHKV
jgi:hypothetical protein